MFLNRYQDRPSTLKVEHELINNDRKGTVHALNEFQITVWEDGEVTAQRKYYAKSDPQSTFPNMTVESGSINLPIDDLVEFLLARITPEELAEGIISDDDARAALLEKLARRYNEPGFTDTDRREFLTKVQQQVYAIAVDRAIERLNKDETNARARDDYYRWKAVEIGHYRGLFEYAQSLHGDDMDAHHRFTQRFTAPDKLAEYFKDNRDPAAVESVGPSWYESRDFWRAELLKAFPEPILPAASPEFANQ
ncbi:hypothetical protein [Mesorhizobium sp. M0088]|uniref:hypothetical protein n=1 Tax=Mesorhizobium sp. M0088 TaxID=2956873 RepID=UPI00333D81CA